MDEITRYSDFDLYIGDEAYKDMPGFLRQNELMRVAEITLGVPPVSPDEELRGIRTQNISQASLIFERTRSLVRDALRAVVGYVFDRFDLPKDVGVDIGSGATGEMVEELLPPGISKSSWVQLEANPSAVAENRRRHGASTIVEGSYLDMRVKNLKVVTGLSSLDATSFLDHAIEEVRSALRDGGYLFHVQDVRPGIGFGFREMQHMGYVLPYTAEIPQGAPDPLTYLVSRKSAEKKYIDVGELFRRNLGRTIQANPGMELLFNKWVTARRPISISPARWYFLNILLQTVPCFPPDNQSMEEVSAVVTVARKKSA